VSESPRPDQSDESPEILESGGGTGGTEPRERPGRPRRRRRWVLGGVGLLGTGAVVAVGLGAWWYTSTGPQPAEALPAGVLGYAAVDLDPSGEQKLAALDLLKKVPAISDELDLGGNPATVDVTGTILDAVLEAEDCDVPADGVSDWLGDRGAVAALVTDEELPAPVFVVQVTDADAARDGLTALAACGDAGSDQEVEESGFIVYHPDGKDEDAPEIGFHVDGEWAVVAEEQDTVDRLVAEREDGTLAEDADFRRWTEAAGDPGVVHLYAAPAAGAWYAEEILTGFVEPMVDFEAANEACPMFEALDETGSVSEEELERLSDEWDRCYEAFEEESADAEPSPEVQELQADLRDFEGAAVTLRFADGAVEVEAAGDLSILGPQSFGGPGGGAAVQALPEDTAVAYGAGFGAGWFEKVLGGGSIVPYAGLTMFVDDAFEELEKATGLRLPEDAELLAGRTGAMAVSGSAGVEDLWDSGDVGGLEAALRVSGDPDPLAELLGRVRPHVPADGRELLDSSSAADALAVGPDQAWRDRLLEDGGLGDTDGFRGVVEHADDASAAFYVDLAAVRGWLPRLLDGEEGEDGEVARNLKPFTRLGASVWEADGAEHGLARLTTKD
jgi:hypothetical protein